MGQPVPVLPNCTLCTIWSLPRMHFQWVLDTIVFISQQWYNQNKNIESMVEQLHLFKIENYKKGWKRYFFGQNLIFDSVPTCSKVAIPQKHITLGQTRTAENFNHSRDWPKTKGIRSGVPVLSCPSSPCSPLSFAQEMPPWQCAICSTLIGQEDTTWTPLNKTK